MIYQESMKQYWVGNPRGVFKGQFKRDTVGKLLKIYSTVSDVPNNVNQTIKKHILLEKLVILF